MPRSEPATWSDYFDEEAYGIEGWPPDIKPGPAIELKHIDPQINELYDEWRQVPVAVRREEDIAPYVDSLLAMAEYRRELPKGRMFSRVAQQMGTWRVAESQRMFIPEFQEGQDEIVFSKWVRAVMPSRDLAGVYDRLSDLDQMLDNANEDVSIDERSREQAIGFLRDNPDIAEPGIAVDDEDGSLGLTWKIKPRGTIAASFDKGVGVEFAAVIPNESGTRRQWINGYLDDQEMFAGIFRIVSPQ